MRSKYLAAMVLAAGLPAAALAAEEKADGVTQWTGDFGLGLLFKRGNTNSDSVNATANASRESAFWRHTAKAEANNQKEKDPDTGDYTRTAENYFASYKLDRKLAKDSKNYLFNVVTYEKDNFSGYQYQASYALGLGRRWFDTPTQRLDTELGPGYRVKCLEPETSYGSCKDKEEDLIARAAVKYYWKISDSAEFTEDVSSEIGQSSTSTRAETALTSKINSHFSMRLRYLLTHESTVPAGTKHADHQLTVGLVYTLK
ncbi:MAG: DUF481 domain-containing protein [Alcanivorax sp.]|nr:DUF481 domain-containing protein [Alcanivorax sp.]